MGLFIATDVLTNVIMPYCDTAALCKLGATNKAYHDLVQTNEICREFIQHYDCSLTFANVCGYGYWHIARWMFATSSDDDKGRAFFSACAEGRIDMAIWLNRYAGNYRNTAFIAACTRGHLRVAKWLHECNSNIYILM